MGYALVDVEDVPYRLGDVQVRPAAPGGDRLRLHADRLPTGQGRGGARRDRSGQEEVYLTLQGGGTLEVDGETLEMRPGRYVLVPPTSRRRPAAGSTGMSFLVIGGVPGGVYEPTELPDE